jgi:hypothetical protein
MEMCQQSHNDWLTHHAGDMGDTANIKDYTESDPMRVQIRRDVLTIFWLSNVQIYHPC